MPRITYSGTQTLLGETAKRKASSHLRHSLSRIKVSCAVQQGTDALAHHATGTKRKERGHTDCASLLRRQRLLGATISDDDVTALRDSRSQIFFNMKPSPSGDRSILVELLTKSSGGEAHTGSLRHRASQVSASPQNAPPSDVTAERREVGEFTEKLARAAFHCFDVDDQGMADAFKKTPAYHVAHLVQNVAETLDADSRFAMHTVQRETLQAEQDHEATVSLEQFLQFAIARDEHDDRRAPWRLALHAQLRAMMQPHPWETFGLDKLVPQLGSIRSFRVGFEDALGIDALLALRCCNMRKC